MVPFLLMSMAALLSCVFGRYRRVHLSLHHSKYMGLSHEKFLPYFQASNDLTLVKTIPPFHPDSPIVTSRTATPEDLSVVKVLPPRPACTGNSTHVSASGDLSIVKVLPPITPRLKNESVIPRSGMDYLTPVSFLAASSRSPFQNIFQHHIYAVPT